MYKHSLHLKKKKKFFKRIFKIQTRKEKEIRSDYPSQHCFCTWRIPFLLERMVSLNRRSLSKEGVKGALSWTMGTLSWMGTVPDLKDGNIMTTVNYQVPTMCPYWSRHFIYISFQTILQDRRCYHHFTAELTEALRRSFVQLAGILRLAKEGNLLSFHNSTLLDMHHLCVFIVRLPSLPLDLCISGLAIALYVLANPPVKQLLSWRQTGYTHKAPCLDWGFHCLVLEFLFKIFRIKVRTQGRKETPASTSSRR